MTTAQRAADISSYLRNVFKKKKKTQNEKKQNKDSGGNLASDTIATRNKKRRDLLV